MRYAVRFQPLQSLVTLPDGGPLLFDTEGEANDRAKELVQSTGCGQPTITQHVVQTGVVKCSHPCYVAVPAPGSSD